MSRRAFTFGLGVLARLGLGGRPPGAEAQPPASRRPIGVLLVLLSPEGKEAQAFRQRLRNAGYVEGRDVVIKRLQLLKGGDAQPYPGRRPMESTHAVSCEGSREPQGGSALACHRTELR